jgi:arylsulfatase A-like enzyme
MVVMLVANRGIFKDFFREPDLEDMEDRIGAIRLPIPDENQSYKVMHGMRGGGGAELKFRVQGEPGSLLKAGLVRVGDRHSRPGEYVFRAYEVNGARKKKLVEISGEFREDSFVLSHGNGITKGLDDGEAEILYELEPIGIRGKLAATIDRIKGIDYHGDFAFITPILVRERKPDEFNVILLSFDTLGAKHLGSLGYFRPTTPHLDEFARQGVSFTQAVTSASWTWPAHQSLFTGLYPSAHLGDSQKSFICYSDDSLPLVLAENGYYTVGITGGGVLRFSFGFHEGFHRFTEFESFGNDVDPSESWEHEDGTPKIFADAMGWLEANRDLKFFMFIHNYECHDPYEDTRFVAPDHEGNLIETRKALYDGDIGRLDDFFGSFIEKLRSLNLLSNTIIVVVSDHGEDLYDHFTEEQQLQDRPKRLAPQISSVDHGHSLYDEILRIPVVFHIPGIRPEKKVIENQISIIDIMPTILDCLSIPYESPVQGASLLGLVRTGERKADPPALSESILWGPEQKAVRMNGYKYIYTENPDKDAFLADIPRHAFFNLMNDPEEKHNIYHKEKEVAKEYHKILEQILEESARIRNSLREQTREGEMQTPQSQEEIDKVLKSLGYL